jgi:two-component system chemotaxis response regulator CheB
MDIRLPGMNGLEATKRIMRERPTPIVVVAASVASDELCVSMNALRYGALAVVEKPVGNTHQDYQAMADRLCTQLALMSQVKVVRHRISRDGSGFPQRNKAALIDRPATPVAAARFRMVGIVASTGGPSALQTVLGGLDPGFTLPVALVQHMSEGFLGGFVSWLSSVCPFRVAIAEEGERPIPRTVYVAPADRHLRLDRDRWRLDANEPVNSQRPSGTILFRSLAKSLGPSALGVLLTGMGEDGALGLKELYDVGGYTIAEDASTAVVYGMPGAAVRLGAVRESLPLDHIGRRLEQLALHSSEVLR